MKKILRFFTFLSSLSVVTVNSLLVTGCSMFTHAFNRDDYVTMLQYNIPGEHDFILKYETKIAKKASSDSINEFNNLYDTDQTHVLWKDYTSLQNDLLSTVMGEQNCKVNWDILFDQEGLASDKKKLAENDLLRLYNIIGKKYGKDMVTKLVQSIVKIPSINNVVAWTSYNTTYNNLRMGFNSDAFNTNFIGQEYRQGWWASNDIISLIAHEFGHAINVYFNLDNDHRTTFNDNWNVNSNNNQCNLVPFGTKNNSLSLQSQEQINDLVIYFIKRLNERGKVIIGKNKDIETVLLPLIVVRSNFGRGAWINDDMIIEKDELFAEAFNEWILTPQTQRNWNWELLNDFFMDDLPKHKEIEIESY